jgi:hypothetical protein
VARPAFKLTAPIVREHPFQAQIAGVLRIEIAPPGKVSRAGVIWWAVDHANYAGEVPGIRIGRGIIAGIPDTFVLYRGRAHHIEIKAEDGALSDAQQSVGTAILFAGGHFGIARSAAEVLDLLDEWQIPRNRRVREGV